MKTVTKTIFAITAMLVFVSSNAIAGDEVKRCDEKVTHFVSNMEGDNSAKCIAIPGQPSPGWNWGFVAYSNNPAVGPEWTAAKAHSNLLGDCKSQYPQSNCVNVTGLHADEGAPGYCYALTNSAIKGLFVGDVGGAYTCGIKK